MISIFTTPGYEHLPNARHSGSFEEFPDGEYSFKFNKTLVENSDVTLIGGCHSALASEILLAYASELARLGPKSLEVINTYFRNARSDRSIHGSSVLAKFQADQWSRLGEVFPGVRLTFVDLHNENILNYFHGPVRVENIKTEVREALLKAALPYLPRRGEVCIATVDEGRSSSLRELASKNDFAFASIVKQRLSGEETRVLEVNGNVKNKEVIIVDDMIATGGSLLNAAEAYRECGASSITAVATHGVFVGAYLDQLWKGPEIDKIYITDSHPNAKIYSEMYPNKIETVPLNKIVPGMRMINPMDMISF